MKKYFEELTDSRQQWKIKYNLCEVVVMAIVAVTAGAEHWSEMALYCICSTSCRSPVCSHIATQFSVTSDVPCYSSVGLSAFSAV